MNKMYSVNLVRLVVLLSIFYIINAETNTTTSTPTLFHVKRPLAANYTRKQGERLRLECDFEFLNSNHEQHDAFFNPNDFTLYWVKNYQELLHTKKGLVHIIRKNMTSILILKNLEPFDSGSYMCVGELASDDSVNQYNASSETTLVVQSANTQTEKSNKFIPKHKNSDLSDYLLSDLNNEDDLTDEFPSLNPTIVENFDDKGFCEPYKGSVCAGIITQNYSIYSTSPQQQEMIEERLKTIIPLLVSNKNNLSKRCSTFAIPSLCLFAFPLCDKPTKQPKQICRMDCKQLQQDICKNEYFNVKSLFESKGGDNLQQQSSNFLLDCHQLPPSSDSPGDCLPIISMTLDKLEAQAIPSAPTRFIDQDKTSCIIEGTLGTNYRGIQSVTRNGFTCQKWNPQFMRSNYISVASQESLAELNDHNYCRNIDNDIDGPWCYTTNPRVPKDYCNIPTCGLNTDLIKTSALDKSLFKETKLIIGAGISLLVILVFIFMIFCVCRSRSSGTASNQHLVMHKQGEKQQSSSTSSSTTNTNSIPILSNLSNGTCTSGASQIHPSRLRMSNVSLGKKQLNHNKNQRGGAGSSKSSVASSSTNQNQNINMEINPFIKNNYDNPMPIFNYQQQQQQQQQQQIMHQVPQFQVQMHHQQHLQQQQQQFQQIQQQQQQQQINNDCDFSVKQFSANNIRLLQEMGKGRFGPLYIGELIGSSSYAPNSVTKCVIKALTNNKTANASKNRLNIDDIQIQTTSTPVVHNPNHHNNNNINNDLNVPNTTAAAHFMEQEFYNEISLYSSLRNKYIANLIGVHTQNKTDENDDHLEDNDDCAMSMLTEEITSNGLPQCMIFEHLNNGDLHEYLIQRASSNSAAVYNGMMMLGGSQSNLSAASSIGGASSNYLNLQQQQRNIADFLYIGQQIASGMEYLASQNFILKDLATRNILMSDNLTIKISIDLVAQYKEAYSTDYYKFQMKTLPVRWMSPESLLYGRYTQQSDVWSYGVCLWEIFNYGCQPYSGCTNPEAIEMIRDRQLLLIPDECPQRAYALMLECWHEIPMQRPTFTEILNRLRNWENYYLFNNNQMTNNNHFAAPIATIPPLQQQQMPPPPLPLPMHLQNQQQTVPSFQMTTSYSSNSQNSKASSLLGNTASTGISASCSPPPLPPPLQINQNGLFCTSNALNPAYYSSPSKQNMNMQNSTNLFASKFSNANNICQNKSSPPSYTCNSGTSRIYRELDPTNSLRLSQRNFNNQQTTFNSNHLSSNLNHIPNANTNDFEL